MTLEEAYRALGLTPPATAEEVKRAYRRRALESHPDRYTDEGDKAFHQRRFMEARDAYARLRSEGFPDLPEESAAPVDLGPKVAGRSFAPKEPEKVGDLQKLGLGVPWKAETILIWAVGLPAALGALAYFVKSLLDSLKGGIP
ncbi:MAG: J domain-containing protein [Elusimicrobia bacterium]|nr:J domain-containing protein [Elusimicrobiota bacterium]